jgi:hypothetical protein
MKKQLFILALILTGAAFAATQVLFQDDFESCTTGDWLGQGATELMESTVNCNRETPAPGEVEIVDMDGSKVLHVNKIESPAGKTSPGSDRGVRVPLNWGSVDYNGGLDGVIIIIGKVNIPNGNGYCELRLATKEDVPMMRFCFHSSDYTTYCYQFNGKAAPNGGAANANDARFADTAGDDKIRYAENDAVVRNTWCDFQLVVDCESGTLVSYHITDGAGFDFTGEKVCHLNQFGNSMPFYAEFTAVGNGYNTTRNGAYIDDLSITYFKADLPWVTVFEDDFQSYTVGQSLTAQTADYQRIGSVETYSDEIKNDVENHGNYAHVWLGTVASGNPKDGIKYVLPEEVKPVFGGKLRFTARYYCPDNGCWTKMFNGDNHVATYGFHSANRWFTTWGTDDASPRYDSKDNSPWNDWVTTRVTIAYDEEGGAYLESTSMTNDKNPANRNGLCWSSYYDTTMPAAPDAVGVQVQGWPNFDGRYAKVEYFKVEYAAPEPAFLGLLALVGLAFLRKQR